jgi:hypothetical protein
MDRWNDAESREGAGWGGSVVPMGRRAGEPSGGPWGGGPTVGASHYDDAWDLEDSYDDAAGGSRLGDLTMVVMIDDQVVDTVRRPVEGSGYECAALELGRGLSHASASPPRLPASPLPAAARPAARPRYEQELSWLRRVVGGVDQLAALDATPLPLDEPLDLNAVPSQLRDRVTAIGEQASVAAERLFDGELVTVCRRMLVALAGSPSLFLDEDRDDQAAGAVLWVAAKANDRLGAATRMPASAVQAICGLTASPAARGRIFAKALAGLTGTGFDPQSSRLSPVLLVGSADYLTGDLRRQIVRLRDLALAERAEDEGRVERAEDDD